MGNTPICLPCASEAPYRDSVDSPTQYRQYLTGMLGQHPALFPKAMDQGFPLHDCAVSVKQDLIVRRSTLQATGAVFTLRPSCVMPYMIARTDAVEKALSRRQWGVPFDALASVFGRDALCWYRAWLAFGRPSLVGTTVKEPQKLPRDLVADEQLTRVARPQVYVPTTVGGGCFLGVSVVEAAETATVERGDGACAKEAKALVPDVSRALGLHRWLGSNAPGVAPAVSHDHVGAVFAPRDPEEEATRRRSVAAPGTRRAWQVSQAATKRQCAQRLRRMAAWTPAPLSGPVATMVLKRCRRRADFTPAYDCPQAHRTSNAVDRLLNSQDRLLDAMRYCHATTASARLAVRAMALPWNVHPYGARLRRDQPSRVAPFDDLNGLQYHPNWLHNLLIASSMGGLRH